jgi:hypothetical protein
MSAKDQNEITVEKMTPKDAARFVRNRKRQLRSLPQEMRNTLFSKIAELNDFQEINFTLRQISDLPLKMRREARRKIASSLAEKDFFGLAESQISILTRWEIFVDCSKDTRKKIIKILSFWNRFGDLSSLVEALPKDRGLLTQEMFKILFERYLIFENAASPGPARLVHQLIIREDCPPEIRSKAIKSVMKIIDAQFAGQRFRWVYELLIHKDLLSSEERTECIKKILSKRVLCWTYLILSLPDLPSDLKEEALSFLRKKTIKGIKSPWLRRLLNKVLQKKWFLLTNDIIQNVLMINEDLLLGNGFVRRLDNGNIIAFAYTAWSVSNIEKEKTIKGRRVITKVLLSVDRIVGGAPSEKVILLRDPNNLQQSFAYRTNPRARTVEEALAYCFQLDPEKFKGFLVEK